MILDKYAKFSMIANFANLPKCKKCDDRLQLYSCFESEHLKGKFYFFVRNLHWVRLIKNLTPGVGFPSVRKRVRPVKMQKEKRLYFDIKGLELLIVVHSSPCLHLVYT